jgi:hypothetical protein
VTQQAVTDLMQLVTKKTPKKQNRARFSMADCMVGFLQGEEQRPKQHPQLSAAHRL